jgi:integrase
MCAEFAELWLDAYPRRAASTRRTYGFAVQRFARDFPRHRLDELSPLDAALWAQRRRWALPAVKAMYADAVRSGLIASDPFAQLRFPTTRGRAGLVPLRPEDVEALEAAALRAHRGAHAETMRALVTVAAWTGARPGELLALTGRDLNGNTLTIRQSLMQTGEIGPPKSGRARTIAFPARARRAIEQLPASPPDQRVFRGRTRRDLTYWAFLGSWIKVREAAHRPSMHFYELRHFCASQLLARGVGPKVVALQLGHQDGGRLVLTTYGHLYPDSALDELRAALDAGDRDGQAAR